MAIYGKVECIASQIGYTHPKAYTRLSVRRKHKEDIGYWYMKNDKIIQVGQLLKRHSQAYTLYDADGLCPTLSSGQKRYGGLPTWIIIYESRGE